MKLRYILPLFMLFGFTACDEEDILKAVLGDDVPIADGDYVTDCIADGSGGSSIISLEVSNDATMRSLQVDVYTDETCTAGETLGTPEDADLELADYGFGNNVSFFTETVSGQEDVYIPYHVDGSDLYVGASEDNLDGEPTEVFSDFIDDPKNSGGTKFTKVEL